MWNRFSKETNDKIYNYVRVLCHYGALVTEFKDAWHFGDGECEYQCWCVLQPHFKASGQTKYSLEALRLQFQVKSLSIIILPNGIGRNIPCDLYNEHIVKLIKDIIANMGPNLTEKALQRAARSSSTLHLVCKQFDDQSNVPVTSAHSTKGDKVDTQKVVTAVLNNNLLNTVPGRRHSKYQTMRLNPLWNWKRKDTIDWIEKKDFMKYAGVTLDDEVAEESSDDDDSIP